jgi:hypothetical protein
MTTRPKSLTLFAACSLLALLQVRSHAALLTVRDDAFNAHAVCQYLPAGVKVQRTLQVLNNSAERRVLRLTVRPRLSTAPGKVVTLKPVEITSVSEPHHTSQVLLRLVTPPVPHNSYYSLTLTLHQGKTLCFKSTESFILVPQGVAGTQVQFAGLDTATKGNWLHVYGRQAFYLPVQHGTAAMNMEGITLSRGSGHEKYGDSPLGNLQSVQIAQKAWAYKAVTDTRVPFAGGGLTQRNAVAFSTEQVPETNIVTHKLFMFNVPLVLRATTSDDKAHLLSLYLLDFKRLGLKERVDVYDVQGQLLDTRQVPPFGNGLYMRYRLKGSVVVVITPETVHSPVCSAMFIDPASGEGFLWSSN